MAYRKEIIVLTGNKYKGVVKLQSNLHSLNNLKGSCNLEFKPKNATLYIMSGTQISEVELPNFNTAFEIPQTDNDEISCVILSDVQPLFGSTKNNVERSKIVALVQKWEKDKIQVKTESQENKVEEIIEEKNDIKDDITQEDITYSMKKDEIIQNSHIEKSDAEIVEEPVTENLDISQPIEVEFENSKDEYSKAETSYFKEGANDSKFDYDKYKTETQKNDFNADIKNQGNIFGEGVQYDGVNFYLAIKPQIDEMFVCYPLDDKLENIIENSKWVRIDADDSYYVVGLIFENSQPKYICYGIPSDYKVKPPKDIEQVCVWLPINENDENGEGYWLIYQSAINGTIIV